MTTRMVLRCATILWVEVGLLATSPLFIAPADLNESHPAFKLGPRPHMVGITFCQLHSFESQPKAKGAAQQCVVLESYLILS